MANTTLAIPRAATFSRRADLWVELKRSRAAYLLMLPFLLHFAVVVAYPFAYSVYLSFFDASLNRPPVFIGLGNFVRLAQDAQFRHSLGNTAYFTVFAMIGETILSLLVAFMMNEQLRGRLVLRTAFFLPVVTSWVIVSIMWSMLFAREGLVNGALRAVGLPIRSLITNADTALWAIAVADTWEWFPFTLLMMLAALQMVPREPIEAAQIDGASQWQIATRIIAPLLKPTILFLSIISVLRAFQVFNPIYAMTLGGPAQKTETITFFIFDQFFQQVNVGYGAAIAMLLFVILFVITLIQLRLGEERRVGQAGG